jgi:hypothetical protein
MRTRHRIPTIFNLSMVDVLCCALGCVILLWLLNYREARRRAVAADVTGIHLQQTQGKLATATRDLDELRLQLDASRKEAQAAARTLDATRDELARTVARADTLAKERDLVRTDLAAARAQAAELTKEMSALQARLSASDDLLRKKTQDAAALAQEMSALREKMAVAADQLRKKAEDEQELSRRLSALEKRAIGLEGSLREREAQAAAAARVADDLAARLREAELRARQMRAGADEQQRTLERAQADLLTRNRELEAARKDLDALQAERTRLADQLSRARADADNRFAGIALTGRRVLFLVDMSGSMELIDERTASAEKWAGVRDTLVKILRSLPELEKFQIVLFEAQTRYLLGHDDRWLDYDPADSPARVHQAMTAVKPKGSTNMYAAFETAFRFRPLGLDTIYVFSDGLPNVGEGLLPETAKTLKETERVEILSRHIRRKLLADWNPPQPGRARVRINTVGFFYESPDVGAFLWALARENDGSFVGMSRP